MPVTFVRGLFWCSESKEKSLKFMLARASSKMHAELKSTHFEHPRQPQK